MSDGRFIELFTEMLLAEKGLSQNTVQSYRADLFDLSKYIGKSLLSLIDRDIERYTYFFYQQGLSAATLARRVSCFKQFYRFLYTAGFIERDIARNLIAPKTRRKLPQFLTLAEMIKIIQVAAEDNSFGGLRLRVLIEVMYATGVRVSELIGIKIGDIRKCNDVVSVVICGKGNKERLVFLYPKAVETVYNYIDYWRSCTKNVTNDSYLFPSSLSAPHVALTRQRVGQLLKIIAVKADLPADKVSPHIIRHSFATHLLNKNIDLRTIQKLLGHEDIGTTQIYMHLIKDDLRNALHTKHPLSRK